MATMPWWDTLTLLATSPMAYGLLVAIIAFLGTRIAAEGRQDPTGPEDPRWPRY